MQSREFLLYKQRFVQATRDVLAQERSESLSEAAFPAYANPNPLMSFLFWTRIGKVFEHLGRRCGYNSVLDFGCGGGVTLPFLAQRAQRVVAADIDLEPLHKMSEHIPLPANVELCDLRHANLDTGFEKSFDVIVALDVLEHVDDLPATITTLCRMLAPGGEIIVSGPTENFAYRLGRRIAGNEYSGDYHVRDIHQIKAAMAARMRVSAIATLFHPVPLFKIYRARLEGTDR